MYSCDTHDKVAGIVNDYDISYIPAGSPKDSPEQEYMSRNQRGISRE